MNKKLLELEFDFDFKLMAITSPLKDYRLCFVINKFTETDFRKVDDLEIELKNKPKNYFSRFLYFPKNTECEFNFITNKGIDGYLIPEMKEVDFFIVIKEFIDEEDLELFLSQIKLIKEIQAVVEINPRVLKSKDNLLF